MEKIGAAVWATGRAGRVIVQAGLTRPWLEFRGGIVFSAAKEGLDLGEACQPYQPLVRVVDTRQCYFVSNLEGKTGARLKAGQTVTLEIDSGGPPIISQTEG